MITILPDLIYLQALLPVDLVDGDTQDFYQQYQNFESATNHCPEFGKTSQQAIPSHTVRPLGHHVGL